MEARACSRSRSSERLKCSDAVFYRTGWRASSETRVQWKLKRREHQHKCLSLFSCLSLYTFVTHWRVGIKWPWSTTNHRAVCVVSIAFRCRVTAQRNRAPCTSRGAERRKKKERRAECFRGIFQVKNLQLLLLCVTKKKEEREREREKVSPLYLQVYDFLRVSQFAFSSESGERHWKLKLFFFSPALWTISFHAYIVLR